MTKSGVDIWRSAMARRGDAENSLAGALTAKEQAQLNRLLKKMTLTLEPE